MIRRSFQKIIHAINRNIRPYTPTWSEAEAYWAWRSNKQGPLTVGHRNSDQVQFKKDYEAHLDFVSPHLDTKLQTIDYGCGIGMYAHLFEPHHYRGVDITNTLLNYAKERHPEHVFQKASKNDRFECEQFFTATVLQHNPDSIVRNIFSRTRASRFVIYELGEQQKEKKFLHARTPEQYAALLSEFYAIKSMEYDTHHLHNQQHNVMVFHV